MIKSQIQNPKSQINSKFQIPITKTKVWNLLFGIWCLVLGICVNAYALNLDKLKIYFLNGEYNQAINEGEKLLSGSSYSQDIDELYYILGLSYLKDGNYLRASDIFEIILKEFKNTALRDEAKLGLGDTYFLRGNFTKAGDYYKELITSNPVSNIKAQVYYRLSQVGYKTGDTKLAKEHLDKLKQEFPLCLELRLNKDLSFFSDTSDFYYTIQVGAFSNITNAKNLTQKLIQQGYPAYMEELNSRGKTSYRVRVGKLRLRQETIDLEKKLSYEGYPTKVYP